MQMQMQRAMGGEQGGQGAFPMPGQTDTTTSAAGTEGGATATPNSNNTTGNAAQTPANPFAALFPGGGAPSGGAGAEGGASQANPFGNMFGGQQSGDQQNNPIAQMTQQMMQSPEMMQNMMRMMGGMGGGAGAGAGAGAGGAGEAGFNPFAAFGGGQNLWFWRPWYDGYPLSRQWYINPGLVRLLPLCI